MSVNTLRYEWKEISGSTDKDGKFSFTSGSSTLLTASKPGMYDVRKSWNPGAPIPGRVQIIMTPADKEVEVTANYCSTIVDSFDDGIEVGINLAPGIPSKTLSQRSASFMPVPLGSPSADSAIIIRVSPAPPLAASNGDGPREWHVELKSQKGWSIQPAFPSQDSDMMTAPKDGYEKQLTYPLALLPSHFFVKNEDGPIYGKLVGFAVQVSSMRKERHGGSIEFLYEIQSRAENTKSLIPSK